MRHHAYFIAGDIEKGIEAALTFGERELGLSADGNPDVIVLRHGLLSVDDARTLAEAAASTALRGKGKLIIASATRFFHEAQNALLKTFEEPPQGTTLILVVPSSGDIIPTLRSRLIEIPLPTLISEIAQEFIDAKGAGREKVVAKILDRAKKDDPDEKQAARADALRLAEGLAKAGYTARTKGDDSPELADFLSDLSRLIPILHERSAPLKPILEHITITVPTKLGR